MVAAAVSLMLALAFLPIILTGPADPATPMPPMSATPPDDLDSGGGVADPGRGKPAPAAASASGVARRVELAAAAVAGGGTSSSSSSSGGYSDNHESRQGFDGQQSWRREQEEGGGRGWAGGGDSAVPEDFSAGRAAGGGATGVVAEGEGGKLRDGRNRCFVGAEGHQRCYPTVFFFGTSKCGEEARAAGCLFFSGVAGAVCSTTLL